MTDSYDHLYKIILVGETKTGKTHTLNSFVKGAPPLRENTPTIGVEFATKIICTKNQGQNVKLQIWDTAGLERYRQITVSHYRKSLGAFIFYDITNRETFTKVQYWIDLVKEGAEGDCQICLIGSKKDIVASDPSLRQVQFEEGLALAKQNNVTFIEISAPAYDEVEEIFQKIAQDIYRVKHQEQSERPMVQINDRHKEQFDQARKHGVMRDAAALSFYVFCLMMLSYMFYDLIQEWSQVSNVYGLIGLRLLTFAVALGIEAGFIVLIVNTRKGVQLYILWKVIFTLFNVAAVVYVGCELILSYSLSLVIYTSASALFVFFFGMIIGYQNIKKHERTERYVQSV